MDSRKYKVIIIGLIMFICGGFGIYQSFMSQRVFLSDIALDNVEALASYEVGNDCSGCFTQTLDFPVGKRLCKFYLFCTIKIVYALFF